MARDDDHDPTDGAYDGSGAGPNVDMAPATGSGTARRMTLATALATELCDLAPAVWKRRASGATCSHVAFVGDDPELADVVAEAWDAARLEPPEYQVLTRAGVAGMVVVVHGPTWSLVARSGGPVLVMSDRIAGVLRIDADPDCEVELTELVAELVNVGQGLPAFDESGLPPMPRLPWHDRRR
ncbi:MAG: hypothetical protein HKP61_23810 [Dactylosporangium sp.]|nr:hypothetical protein [Dactylosporangium sp.]NNJ63906.1 hypothetical protein [Dactylosporangium sp.]